MYTRTITFRSDTELDHMIKELQKYHKHISKLNQPESIIIRSAIIWYYDQIKNDNEYNLSDSS